MAGQSVLVGTGVYGFPVFATLSLGCSGFDAHLMGLYYNQMSAKKPGILECVLRDPRVENFDLWKLLSDMTIIWQIDDSIDQIEMRRRLSSSPVISDLPRKENTNKLFLVGDGIGGNYFLQYIMGLGDNRQINGIVAHSPRLVLPEGFPKSAPDFSRIPSSIPILLIFRDDDLENVDYACAIAGNCKNVDVKTFTRCGFPQSLWGLCKYSELSQAWQCTLGKLREWSAKKV